MEYFLSGLFGALIATIFTVFYLYISEQTRVRRELALEVISYLDGVYTTIRILADYLQKIADEGKSASDLPEEYRTYNNKLTTMLLSTKPHTHFRIIYGEGNKLATLNKLFASFQDVTGKIQSLSYPSLGNRNKEIYNCIINDITPLKEKIQNKLIDGVSASAIILELPRRIKHQVLQISRKITCKQTK